MNRIYWTKTGRLRTEGRYRELLSNWPVPVEEFRFPTAQGETFVLASGRANSPPLVLLHGGLSNSLCWMPCVRLAAQYFRVYSIDTIGDPGFSAPARPSFATNAHADWLDEIWRALSLTQAAVCGWSLGGWLALDLAIRHPANVRALVTLAPAGIVPIHRGTIAKILTLMLLGSKGRKQAFLYSMGFQNESALEDLTSFVDFSLFAQTAAVGRTRLPGLFTDDALRTIGVPKMLMIGERDVFFNARRTIQRVQACLPNATVCCPTDIGHGLLAHMKPVLDFLRRTDPSATLSPDLLSIPST